MRYIVYQTTNLVNGKIYIGVHGGRALTPWYLGSGVALVCAIRKYGRTAFRRETLFEFNNAEDVLAKERELVTAKFCARRDTYNVRVGGKGGWEFVNSHNFHWARSDESRLKVSAKIARATQSFKQTVGHKWVHHEGTEKNVTEELVGGYLFSGWKLGRAAQPSANKGCLNPGCGRRWITRDGVTVRVAAAVLGDYIAAGWCLGRAISTPHRYAYAWMTDGVTSKLVTLAKVKELESRGWQRGRS